MLRGGVNVYLYSFFNLGARWGWVANATPKPLYPSLPPPGMNLYQIVQEAGWAPGPVWTGVAIPVHSHVLYECQKSMLSKNATCLTNYTSRCYETGLHKELQTFIPGIPGIPVT